MLGGEREERVTVEVIDELLKSMEVGLAFRNYNGRISSMDFHSPQLQGHRRCRPAALISHLDVAHFAWIVVQTPELGETNSQKVFARMTLEAIPLGYGLVRPMMIKS